jgi:hypothetical protein
MSCCWFIVDDWDKIAVDRYPRSSLAERLKKKDLGFCLTGNWHINLSSCQQNPIQIVIKRIVESHLWLHSTSDNSQSSNLQTTFTPHPHTQSSKLSNIFTHLIVNTTPKSYNNGQSSNTPTGLQSISSEDCITVDLKIQMHHLANPSKFLEQFAPPSQNVSSILLLNLPMS